MCGRAGGCFGVGSTGAAKRCQFLHMYMYLLHSFEALLQQFHADVLHQLHPGERGWRRGGRGVSWPFQFPGRFFKQAERGRNKETLRGEVCNRINALIHVGHTLSVTRVPLFNAAHTAKLTSALKRSPSTATPLTKWVRLRSWQTERGGEREAEDTEA